MKRCSKCRLPVYWENKHCFNPDGSDHWGLCREITFGEIKAFGVFFKTEKEEGYIHEGKKVLTAYDGQTIEGAEFDPCQKDVAGLCKTPPWEICYDCESELCGYDCG